MEGLAIKVVMCGCGCQMALFFLTARGVHDERRAVIWNMLCGHFRAWWAPTNRVVERCMHVDAVALQCDKSPAYIVRLFVCATWCFPSGPPHQIMIIDNKNMVSNGIDCIEHTVRG